ncbi:MAG TPA: hypothetical protein VKA30_12055 [Actinomycetota bacterium]|nr:hypothetical protein [Actinomycetota bacterium]
MGPLVDVTDRWQAFQPAGHFCVKPDRFELSGSSGPFTTGNNPACRRSGFGPTDKGLYEVTIRAPRLCAGCRRLFIDYSKIPPKNSPPLFYAHGHAYLRLQSINPTYSVDPIAHSPNIKNFTNDKLVAPTGSLQEQIATAIDTYDMAYVGDTKFFVHSQVQGPYYIGPWYVNRSGERITGAYLDLDAMDAVRLPFAVLNLIRYMSGFRSGEPTCPDALFGYTDADAFYGGCVDQMGGSAEAIDPFS